MALLNPLVRPGEPPNDETLSLDLIILFTLVVLPTPSLSLEPPSGIGFSDHLCDHLRSIACTRCALISLIRLCCSALYHWLCVKYILHIRAPMDPNSLSPRLISPAVPYEAVRSVPLPPQGGVGIGMLPGNAGSSSRPHHNHVDALNA